MGLHNITSGDYTNLSGVDYEDMPQYEDTTLFTDFYSVESQDTEGGTGFGEVTYQPDWTKWHGYYRTIPEFQAVIDRLGSWTVGRGFEADEKTKKALRKIRGFGKDDFNTLCENFVRTALICGDSFAEIMRDKAHRIINLKPLNPGSMKIVGNEYGLIKRYEQTAQIPQGKTIKFDKKEIFHLPWDRIADEIHGIPFAQKLEWLIKMRNEAMHDLKVMFHRYVKPIQIVPVDTDDSTEISDFKTNYENAYKKVETIIVPKGTVDVENIKHISLPQFSTLDPLPWLNYLIRTFTTSAGVPEIIHGWGQETTEASSKIIYLAFQQTIERLQRWFEAQLDLQLGIDIKLEFPASIEPELINDNKKDVPLNREGVNPTKDQK